MGDKVDVSKLKLKKIVNLKCWFDFVAVVVVVVWNKNSSNTAQTLKRKHKRKKKL